MSDLKARKKQLEDAVQPIIVKFYAEGAGGPQPRAEAESVHTFNIMYTLPLGLVITIVITRLIYIYY